MSVDFNSLLPHELILIGGTVIFLWVAVAVVFDLIRWRDVIGSYGAGSETSTAKAILGSLGRTITEDVLVQRKIRDCNLARWFSHLAVFWGFIMLAASTTLDAMLNSQALPLPITSPVRLVGNLGGVLFMSGLAIMVYRRAFSQGVRRSSTLADVFFLAVLCTAGITGFLTEILSDGGSFSALAAVYWTHLMTVAALFVLAPFTKFVHALGRPLLAFLERYAVGTGTRVPVKTDGT